MIRIVLSFQPSTLAQLLTADAELLFTSTYGYPAQTRLRKRQELSYRFSGSMAWLDDILAKAKEEFAT